MASAIFEHTGVSILIGMVSQDVRAVVGKNKPEPKDKEGFCRDTGKLIIFFAIGSFLMAGLELFNATVAFVQMAVWVVISFMLWKKVNEKYY